MIMHLMHFFFFFNDTATTEIYTLSLHDALPIFIRIASIYRVWRLEAIVLPSTRARAIGDRDCKRSEEHTSELQSLRHLVCRLLLEKKKQHRCPPAAASAIHATPH